MGIAVSLCKRLKANSVDRWGREGTGNRIVARADETSKRDGVYKPLPIKP
jgi:hypothetical protein